MYPQLTARTKLADLLWSAWMPSYCHLWRIHRWLDTKLRDRRDLAGWLWRLFHVREWQKSAAQSAVFWILATTIIFKLVARLGYNWELNIAVSLCLDGVTYAVNRLWIWPKRERAIGIVRSSSRNIGVWASLALLNGGMAWLLMSPADMGTRHARYLLGVYGVAINALIFLIRDKLVFNPAQLRELAEITWRTLRRTAIP